MRIVAIILGMLAFTGLPQKSYAQEASLSGEWTFLIFEVPGENIPTYPPGKFHKPVKIRILQDSTLQGNSFRTSISGRVSTNGNRLTVHDYATGKTAMENKWGNLILKHLPEVEKFRLSQDSLSLTIGTGETMIFIRSSSMDIKTYDRYTKSVQRILLPGDLFYFFTGFKQGSEWVYKSENSADIHTMRVSSYNNLYYRTRFQDDLHHLIQYSMTEIETQARTQFWMYANSETNFSLVISGTDKSGRMSGDQNCQYSVSKVQELYVNGCGYSVEWIGNMTVNKKKYPKVIKLKALNPGKNPHLYETAFLAEDVGIIRKEYPDGRTYNLVRYDIQKK